MQPSESFPVYEVGCGYPPRCSLLQLADSVYGKSVRRNDDCVSSDGPRKLVREMPIRSNGTCRTLNPISKMSTTLSTATSLSLCSLYLHPAAVLSCYYFQFLFFFLLSVFFTLPISRSLSGGTYMPWFQWKPIMQYPQKYWSVHSAMGFKIHYLVKT